MKNNRTIFIWGVLCTALLLMAYRGQPQDAENEATELVSPVDASTACDASTDATADLSCVSTGDITVAGWNQVTIGLKYRRETGAAGTSVYMQCDRQFSSDSVRWFSITTVDSAGNSTVRTWKHAATANAQISWDFQTNAEKLRCRFWVVTGNSNDLIGRVYVRKASEVGR